VVQNVHLSATVVRGSAGDIRYTHQLQAGPCPVSAEYGVELAAACGWPLDVFQEACAIQRQVEESLPDDRVCDTRPNEQEANMAVRAMHMLEEIRRTFEHLASHDSRLSSGEKHQQLCDLQDRIVLVSSSGSPASDDGEQLQRALEGILFDEAQPRQSLIDRPHTTNDQKRIDADDDANVVDDKPALNDSKSNSSLSSSSSGSGGSTSSDDSDTVSNDSSSSSSSDDDDD
jgi:hypothetical protein